MIYDIGLEIAGDCWYNAKFLEQNLCNFDHKPEVLIDLKSEGPSLQAVGVVDLLSQWCRNTGRRPSSIVLNRWSNPVEWVPFTKRDCSNRSHFFSMALEYWHNIPPEYNIDQTPTLFGFFVGRLTVSRSVMLYQVSTEMVNQSVVSKMPSKSQWPWDVDERDHVNLENYNDWLPLYQQMRMIRWYQHACPASIDGTSVQDQFTSPVAYRTTNLNLINYYNQFGIELVAETYTLGNTFFPTEKTVRPLMAMKPIFVYGPKYFLARLKELGFETWSHLWDENYDLYEGPERWNMIKSVMHSISRNSIDKNKKLLAEAREVALHNRKKLLELSGQVQLVPGWIRV